MSIEVKHLNKRFGDTVVCDHLNLEIGDGELVALLGPSGSGKTSLLRIMAGLELPDTGRVLFDGQDVTDTDVRDRQVGFVFQHYALFPQMTNFENVAFGLRVRPRDSRPSARQIKARVDDLLKLVQLEGVGDRYPHQLSGGQRQRIALARALAVEPRVLLLDEPFGALDARVRKDLRRWLRRLHAEMQVTTVFVTHDQDEAMEVADRIVVMNRGRIEQAGPPDEVYDRPATPFVLQFLGDVNLFQGGPGRAAATPGADVHYVRPHELDVVAAGGPDGDGIDGIDGIDGPDGPAGAGSWAGELAQVLSLGPVMRLEFKRDDGSLVDVDMPRARWLPLQQALQLQPGSRAWLKPRRVTRFAAG